jgi:hypothetical protein
MSILVGGYERLHHLSFYVVTAKGIELAQPEVETLIVKGDSGGF